MSSVQRNVRKSFRWQIVLVLLLVLAVGASSLGYPFGRDQGDYATMATR